jgi:hypothetical protein
VLVRFQVLSKYLVHRVFSILAHFVP